MSSTCISINSTFPEFQSNSGVILSARRQMEMLIHIRLFKHCLTKYVVK